MPFLPTTASVGVTPVAMSCLRRSSTFRSTDELYEPHVRTDVMDQQHALGGVAVGLEQRMLDRAHAREQTDHLTELFRVGLAGDGALLALGKTRRGHEAAWCS